MEQTHCFLPVLGALNLAWLHFPVALCKLAGEKKRLNSVLRRSFGPGAQCWLPLRLPPVKAIMGSSAWSKNTIALPFHFFLGGGYLPLTAPPGLCWGRNRPWCPPGLHYLRGSVQ